MEKTSCCDTSVCKHRSTDPYVCIYIYICRYKYIYIYDINIYIYIERERVMSAANKINWKWKHLKT